MSLPKSEELKDSSIPVDAHATWTNGLEVYPVSQHGITPQSHGLLSAPLTGPIRPLSPDALSILSTEEYDQIQHDQQTHREIRDPRPAYVVSTKGWRSSMRESWTRNYGLVLMLLAQFFGTCMNVLTRLLEIEGNKGKGLHPFQILFARMFITVVLASLYATRRAEGKELTSSLPLATRLPTPC